MSSSVPESEFLGMRSRFCSRDLRLLTHTESNARSTPADSFARGHFFISDPDELETNKDKIKLGIHSKPPRLHVTYVLP